MHVHLNEIVNTFHSRNTSLILNKEYAWNQIEYAFKNMCTNICKNWWLVLDCTKQGDENIAAMDTKHCESFLA